MRLAWATLCIAMTGCRTDHAEPAPAATAPSATATPSASAPAPVASAKPKRAARDAAAPDGGRAAPVGGNWLKCYANFQPRNDPKLEVMRLGLLCGPSNGMKKAYDAEGQAVSGMEHRFEAGAGECFRVFAVGAPSIEDLDVEVFDPSGKRLAWDTSDDRWPIVDPDGPFCTLAAGQYRAVVRAARGSGRYAVEIWRLR
jgi:hypothetical protein